jgi:hypothetical protein
VTWEAGSKFCSALAGKKTVNATVGFDPGGITVTPTDTGNTNSSGQGTP